MPQLNTLEALKKAKNALEQTKTSKDESRQKLESEEHQFIEDKQDFEQSLNVNDADSENDKEFKKSLANIYKKYNEFNFSLGVDIDSIDHQFEPLVNEHSPREELKKSLRDKLNTLMKHKKNYELILMTVQSEKNSENNVESLTDQINILNKFIQLTEYVNNNHNSDSEKTLIDNLGRVVLDIIEPDNQETVSDLLKSHVDLSNSEPKSELIYQVAQPLLKALDTRDLNERKQYFNIFNVRYSNLEKQNSEANPGQKSATITYHNLDLPQPNELRDDRTMSAASKQNESEAEACSGNNNGSMQDLSKQEADNNTIQQGSNEQEVDFFLGLLQKAISIYHFSKDKNSKTNAYNQIEKDLNFLVERIQAEDGVTRQQCIDTFSKNIDVLLLFVKKCHDDNRLSPLLEDELKKLVDNIPQEQYTNVEAREQFARLRDISRVYRNDHLSPSISTIYKQILAQPHVQKYFKNNPDDALNILKHSYAMFETKWNQDNQPKNTDSHASSQVKAQQQTNKANVDSPVKLNQVYTDLVRSAKKSRNFNARDIDNQIRMIVEQHGHANSKEEKAILDKQLGEFLKDGIIFKNKYLQTLDEDESDNDVSIVSALSNIDDTNIREKYLDVFLNNKKRLNKILDAKWHSHQFTAKFDIKPIDTSHDQENEQKVDLGNKPANAGHLRQYLTNRKIRAKIAYNLGVDQSGELKAGDELKAEMGVRDVIDNAKHKSAEDVAKAIDKLIKTYTQGSENACKRADTINQDTLEDYLNKLLTKGTWWKFWKKSAYQTSAYKQLSKSKKQLESVRENLESLHNPELVSPFLEKIEKDINHYKFWETVSDVSEQYFGSDKQRQPVDQQQVQRPVQQQPTEEFKQQSQPNGRQRSKSDSQIPEADISEGAGRNRSNSESDINNEQDLSGQDFSLAEEVKQALDQQQGRQSVENQQQPTEESEQQSQSSEESVSSTEDKDKARQARPAWGDSLRRSVHGSDDMSEAPSQLQEELASTNSQSDKLKNAEQALDAINNAKTSEELGAVMQQIDDSFYDPLQLDNENNTEFRVDIMSAVRDKNRNLGTINQGVAQYRRAWQDMLSLKDKQQYDQQEQQDEEQTNQQQDEEQKRQQQEAELFKRQAEQLKNLTEYWWTEDIPSQRISKNYNRKTLTRIKEIVDDMSETLKNQDSNQQTELLKQESVIEAIRAAQTFCNTFFVADQSKKSRKNSPRHNPGAQQVLSIMQSQLTKINERLNELSPKQQHHSHDQSLEQDGSIAQSGIDDTEKTSSQRKQIKQDPYVSKKLNLEAESKTNDVSKTQELKQWIDGFRDTIRDYPLTPESRALLVKEFGKKTEELQQNLNAKDQTDRLTTRLHLVDRYRYAYESFTAASRRDLPKNPPEPFVEQQLNATKPVLEDLEEQLVDEQESVNECKSAIDKELDKIDDQLEHRSNDTRKINIGLLKQATDRLKEHLNNTGKGQVKTEQEETMANNIRGCYDELSKLDGLSQKQKDTLKEVKEQLDTLHPQSSHEAAASSANNPQRFWQEENQQENQVRSRIDATFNNTGGGR